MKARKVTFAVGDSVRFVGIVKLPYPYVDPGTVGTVVSTEGFGDSIRVEFPFPDDPEKTLGQFVALENIEPA